MTPRLAGAEPSDKGLAGRTRLVVVSVVTTAVVASCLASVAIGQRDAGPGLVQPAHAALTPFEDCADVRDWYVDSALPT